jgi:hypothetical protein
VGAAAFLSRHHHTPIMLGGSRTREREEGISMKSKRQTTIAKLARERLVQERRARKREKKQAAAAAAREAPPTADEGSAQTTD